MKKFEESFAKQFNGILTKKQIQVLAKYAVSYKVNLNQCEFETKLPKDIIVAPLYDECIPVLNKYKYNEMIDNNDIVIIKLQKTVDINFDTIVYFFETAFYEKDGVFKEMDDYSRTCALDYTLIFRNYDSNETIKWIELFMGLITNISICKKAVVYKALIDNKIKKYFDGKYDTNLSIKENVEKKYKQTVKSWFNETLKTVSFDDCINYTKDANTNLYKLKKIIDQYTQLIELTEKAEKKGITDLELVCIKSAMERVEQIIKYKKVLDDSQKI